MASSKSKRAAQVLQSFGVTLDAAREQVESIVGYGEEGTGTQAPFTPRSKKVLELALGESMQLGHNHIGAEHLLLGLTREGEGVAARVFFNLGVDPDNVRREVLRRLGVDEEDALDRVERGMEEATDKDIFRIPVGSVRTIVRVKGRPRMLLVDLISVGEARGTDESSGTAEPGRLLDRVAEVVEGKDYGSLEGAIEESGDLVLGRLPEVDEIEVSVFRERWFERRTGSGITKTRTFRR